MVNMIQTRQLEDLQYINNREARDSGYGGGGGGCGGFEVFAFLAFLLALLDLIMDMNDMGDGGGARSITKRNVKTTINGSICQVDLNLEEGAWAVNMLSEGVLKAISSPPPCDRHNLCQAALETTRKGPLATSFTLLASDWLDEWPEFAGTAFGTIIRNAASTGECDSGVANSDFNCTFAGFPDRVFDDPTIEESTSVKKGLWTKMKNHMKNYSKLPTGL